jgi:uncharacterized membrane protein
MEKMIVAVFENEPKAYDGARTLAQLDAEGSIAIHAQAVIKKNADGTATVKQATDEFPVGTLGGTALGSLIGLLEGPVGMAVGATVGLLAGTVGDLFTAGVDSKFVDDVAARLTPGKCAVIADISEEWETPVDTRMEALSGTVLRTPKTVVEQDHQAREIAALRAEVAELKAEYANARDDAKLKLKARIDELEAGLQDKLHEAQLRSERMRKETEAKIETLERKAAKTQGEMKATLDGRIQQIRRDYDESQARIKHMLADKLTEAAAHLRQ